MRRVLIMLAAALAAPLISPHDPLRQSLLLRLKPPGSADALGIFLLGTDDLGRDLFSRILYGARASFAVATLSVVVSLAVGVTLGLVAGWVRGIAAAIIMRLVDTMLSIPAILLAVLTVAVIGPSFTSLVMVLGLTRWPRYTRVAYASTLQVAAMPFVQASEMAGASTARILARHVLPNIAGPLMVVATSEFGLMILFEAGLSFLGLGIQPPLADWGSMVHDNSTLINYGDITPLLPAGAIALLTVAVNFIVDWFLHKASGLKE